jgi:hypothetical protein
MLPIALINSSFNLAKPTPNPSKRIGLDIFVTVATRFVSRRTKLTRQSYPANPSQCVLPQLYSIDGAENNNRAVGTPLAKIYRFLNQTGEFI